MTPIFEDKTWAGLQQYPWVRDMQDVPQSPLHHAEGNVAIHTQMVLDALANLEEYKALSADTRELIWTAALMHDIEKRSTTVTDDDGNISSPGHAKKGAQTANQLLYRHFNIPFASRMEIVGLVRHHGFPLWALQKPDPIKALLKTSLEVNTEWVYLLAKADVLGRICADKNNLMERLEFFKELCIEQNCWGKPKQFPSNLSKFTYFRKDEQNADYVPFEDTKSDVIILSGIAGSGKDRFLTLHYPKLPVVSLDQLRRDQKIDRNDSKGNGRVIQQALELAKQHLRKGAPFAWNATNITTQMRDQLISQFAVYKPHLTLVYVEVPYTKLLSQNKSREHPIPESALQRMIDKLEVPKPWEANQVQYHVQ